MGIEIEYPLGYASSGILYFVTPAIDYNSCTVYFEQELFQYGSDCRIILQPSIIIGMYSDDIQFEEIRFKANSSLDMLSQVFYQGKTQTLQQSLSGLRRLTSAIRIYSLLRDVKVHNIMKRGRNKPIPKEILGARIESIAHCTCHQACRRPIIIMGNLIVFICERLPKTGK